MSATILITRQLPETVLQRLGEACQYRCGVVSGSITRAALLAGVEGVDGLI
ncbi:MAG: hypothetical protein RIR86_1949, partial [Acidobacteriota bacterium]